MKREEVYASIDTEREFQDLSIKEGKSHIVEDFPMGSALSAIQHKLHCAREEWYAGNDPFLNTMEELRKIAAICVKMGEKYGMPQRSMQ